MYHNDVWWGSLELTPIFVGKKIIPAKELPANVVEFLEILWLPNGSSTIQGINQKEKHPWLPVKTLVDPQ